VSDWKPIAVGVVLAALCACEEERPPPTFRVTFTARADDAPLAGVRVIANGRGLGETNERGVLRVDIAGREGQAVAVNAQCPDGHRQPERLPLLTLRAFRGLDPAAQERGIEMSIACPPTERTAAVVIRAGNQAGLPVTMSGREVARTDDNGVAHVVFQMQPNTTFRLQLDTTGREDLQPQSPGATFTVADADDIFLFDQPFQIKQKRRRWRPRAAAPPEAPTAMVPMRID
jgi:hypothetical protein